MYDFGYMWNLEKQNKQTEQRRTASQKPEKKGTVARGEVDGGMGEKGEVEYSQYYCDKFSQ